MFFNFTRKKKANLIMYYSNINTPNLKFFIYKDGVLENQVGFDLEFAENEYSLDFEFIKNKMEALEIPIMDFELVLSLDRSFKTIHLYPKMNYYKTLWFEQRDLKASIPTYKTNYQALEYYLKGKKRQVFEKYFIPNKALDLFKQLAEFLGVKLLSFNSYANFLYFNSYLNVKDNYLGIDIYNGVCNLISVYDNKLVNMEEFTYETEEDILGRILILMGKNELEFDLDPVSKFVLSSDITVNFKSLYQILDRVHNGIDFSNYKNNGVKLK